jgi:hypothetical protein
MDRSPARLIVWDHKLHVTGGASGLATMVAVFLEVVVVLWPFANLSYVGFRTKNLKEKVNNVTSCPTLACTTPSTCGPLMVLLSVDTTMVKGYFNSIIAGTRFNVGIQYNIHRFK